MHPSTTRRSFLKAFSYSAVLGLSASGLAQEKKSIPGFEKTASDSETSEGWKPFSDRKIRVGLVGYGYCQFAAAFSFQDHPNVEVVAVSDLIPERCDALAKAVRCDKKYTSLEEMVKDKRIDVAAI